MKAVSNRVLRFGMAFVASLSFMLLGLSATAVQASGEDAFSQTPLFLTDSAPENVIFGFDDTASLDFEMVFPRVPKGTATTDGRLELLARMIPGFTDVGEKIKGDLMAGVRYGYLFEAGLNAGYNAQRINPDFDVVPPLRIYGFMRSAEYNPQFYDPSVQYRPWPTMPEADPGDPLLDPMHPLRFGDTQRNSSFLGEVVSDLGSAVSDFFDALLCIFFCSDAEDPPPFLELQYRPFAMSENLRSRIFADFEVTETVLVETLDGLDFAHITDGTACGLDAVADGIARYEGLFDLLDPDASALNTRPVCIANHPASYYYPVESGTYEWRDSSSTIQSGICEPGGNDGAREDYLSFLEGYRESSLKFKDDAEKEFPGTLAPDGVCLREVSLARSWEAGSDDINADVYDKFERTFEQELQNFANWFTYHRRRHHSLRATIGESAVRMDNARGALMKSSEASAPEDVVMLDLSDDGDLELFLSQVYNAYNGTTADHQSLPRTLLNSAGVQYQRQDAGAPVILECQRNFTVLYTDGYSSEGELSGVGNEDGAAGAPFADSFAGTLGDIAWKYYQDLGLSGDTVGSAFPAGRVPTPTECRNAEPDPSVDCNSNLHMNTFAVSPGRSGESILGHPVEEGSELRYLLRSDAHAHPPAWPDVNASDALETAVQRDDLYHAVVNGFGEIYRSSDAFGAAAGMRNAMTSTLASQFESITSVAISRDAAAAGASLYSASFETVSWTGRLTARLLDPSARNGDGENGGLEDAVLGDVEWEAGGLLDDRMAGQSQETNLNPRQIITSNDSGQGIPFRWNGDQALRTEAIADLRRDQDEAAGQARLEYLRGYEPEGYKFRERGSLLGDIVHSSPVYVGAPRQLWPDIGPFPTEEGKRYSDFKELNRGRDPMIYVGANDGMLHGFSAAVGEEAVDGGQERLAYIPGFAYNSSPAAGLSLLTELNYNHRYYVDLTPSISDAFFQGHGDTKQWHSVLLGGMRTGGRGLFALDVTNPGNFSEDNASNLLLWEFTHPDLGFLTEPMNVALVPWAGAENGHAWVAVFGNGYLPESGRAGLFMLRMDGGVDGTWTEGTDFRFIEVDGTAGDGLTSDARLVDLDRSGVTDRIYATGRDGRVWVFASEDGHWSSAYTEAEGSTVAAPLFTATDAQGKAQPITTGVMVTRNPFVGSDEGDPNLLVFFGTGSYLSGSDLTDFSTQSFYGVWDSGSTQEMGRGDLQQHSIVTTTSTDGEFRNIDDNAIDWKASGIGGHQGWYFDFDDAGAPGERIVQMPRVEGSILFFNTTIPEQNPCAAGGSGFRMFVSLGGSDPTRAVFDANNDGVLSGDPIYSGFRHTDGLLSGGQLFGGLLLDNTTGIHVGRDEETRATLVDFESNQRRGRLGWQELIRTR